MAWLKPMDYKKQEYMELRLNAPLGEHIRLDFNPLKVTDTSNSSPNWNQVYPIIDASDNTERDSVDVCFDNWIKQDDWIKIIHNIEVDLINFSKDALEF